MSFDVRLYQILNNTSVYAAKAALPDIIWHLGGVPRSVLDIGCGTGEWLKAFRNLYGDGIDLCGIDGEWVSGEYRPNDQYNIKLLHADLTQTPFVQEIKKPDLTIALFVLEYLDEEAGKYWVDWMCQNSEAVLFAAMAEDKTTGRLTKLKTVKPHHYWHSLFAQNGFYNSSNVQNNLKDINGIGFYSQAYLYQKRPEVKEMVTLTDNYIKQFAISTLINISQVTLSYKKWAKCNDMEALAYGIDLLQINGIILKKESILIEAIELSNKINSLIDHGDFEYTKPRIQEVDPGAGNRKCGSNWRPGGVKTDA